MMTGLFENLKMFYRTKEADSFGVQLFLTYVLLVWETALGVSKKQAMKGLFENLKCFIPQRRLFCSLLMGFQKHNQWQAFLKTLKCFIPRREAAKAAPKGSIWWSLFNLIWFRKRILDFFSRWGNSLFEILKMFNPPEGSCFADS